MDCSLPVYRCQGTGSSVHGILQARVLEWVAISFSRGSSWPRDRTQVSCNAVGFFTVNTPGSQNNLGPANLWGGSGRSPGEGNGNPLQYSGLENPHGQRSLVGCSLWGCRELDRTERLSSNSNIWGMIGNSICLTPNPSLWPAWFWMSVFSLVLGINLKFQIKKKTVLGKCN